MNYLKSIANKKEKIAIEYRNATTPQQMLLDLEDIDFRAVTNQHLFNLRALLKPTTKTVHSINYIGQRDTGDLEIDDESHSYFVNGVPTHNTVNIPSDYPFEDFQNIYLDAYKTGFIKGLTTYRAGSMTSVLSAVEQKTDENEEVILTDVKLPDNMQSELKVLRDHEAGGTRKWYCTVGLNENNAPVALFVTTNAMEKSVITNDVIDRLITLARVKGIPSQFIDSIQQKFAGDNNSTKIARAIGLLLRHGVRIQNIVIVLDKVSGVTFSSFVFHIKKLLQSYIKDGQPVIGENCSECGGKLIYESGCQRCSQCSNSKCG